MSSLSQSFREWIVNEIHYEGDVHKKLRNLFKEFKILFFTISLPRSAA